MSELLTTEALSAFLQVIMIDLVLAGDNAIVIGLAAAGLPKEQRDKAILIGIIAATVLRIVLRAASPRSSCRSSACCWPAASCCCGCAGRCGASCAPATAEKQPEPRRRWRIATSTQDGTIAGVAPRKTFAAGGLADRHRRRVDVARQRAGGGGRGAATTRSS